MSKTSGPESLETPNLIKPTEDDTIEVRRELLFSLFSPYWFVFCFRHKKTTGRKVISKDFIMIKFFDISNTIDSSSLPLSQHVCKGAMDMSCFGDCNLRLNL